MDDQTKSPVPDQIPANFVKQFAALLYYAGTENTPEQKQYEELEEKEQSPWLRQVLDILLAIDKLNMMLVKKVSQEESEQKERKNIEILTQIISDFVKGLKTTKPSLFPSEELAHRILK